jgi:acetyltransferase-like isoleucine patch superfamily enzyme
MAMYLAKLSGRINNKLKTVIRFWLGIDQRINVEFETGLFTYGSPKILSWGENKKVIIGKFCSIAGDVKIFLGGNHRIDWISTYPFNERLDSFSHAKEIKGHPYSKGDVIIGNDVWVGHGVTILSGVKIGNGAVIGAETVVSKNVDAYTVVVGNPMVVKRKRFTADQIIELERIKWWDWNIDKINKNLNLICSNEIDQFIKIIRDDI